jgi:hypothetical protein
MMKIPTDEQIRELKGFVDSNMPGPRCRKAAEQALLSAYVITELQSFAGLLPGVDLAHLVDSAHKLHDALWHDLNVKCASLHPAKF